MWKTDTSVQSTSFRFSISNVGFYIFDPRFISLSPPQIWLWVFFFHSNLQSQSVVGKSQISYYFQLSACKLDSSTGSLSFLGLLLVVLAADMGKKNKIDNNNKKGFSVLVMFTLRLSLWLDSFFGVLCFLNMKGSDFFGGILDFVGEIFPFVFFLYCLYLCCVRKSHGRFWGWVQKRWG